MYMCITVMKIGMTHITFKRKTKKKKKRQERQMKGEEGRGKAKVIRLKK